MISVLTTSRRPDYLVRTLLALDEAGAKRVRRVVNVDGFIEQTREVLKPHPSLATWELATCSYGYGTLSSMCAVLCAAAETGEDLLYFEDDILPCKNAVTALLNLDVPKDTAFIVACDIAAHAKDMGPGIHRVAGDGARPWGNQALKIPARTLKWFAEQRIPTQTFKHGSDTWLRLVCAGPDSPWRTYGVLHPDLFDHVGAASAVDPAWTLTGPHRRPVRFPGVDFDASMVNFVDRKLYVWGMTCNACGAADCKNHPGESVKVPVAVPEGTAAWRTHVRER